MSIFIPDSQIDFHEFGMLTKFEIEDLLTKFIEDSYYAECKNVLVITGKGEVIRPLVKFLLQKNKYVESFKTAGYFNGQESAFEVVLK